MSDNTQTGNSTPTPVKLPPPDLSKVELYTVNRNGVDKQLEAFAGKRGAWLNQVYQAPQMTDEGFDTDVTWFGKMNIIRAFNIIARRIAQDYWEDSIPETGEQQGIFQQTTFLRYIADWSAASMKISELQELVDEASAKMANSSAEFIARFSAATTQEEKDAAGAWFKGLSDNYNSLRAELAARKGRRSKEAASETVTPE